MDGEFLYEGRLFRVAWETRDGRTCVNFEGRQQVLDVRRLSESSFSILIDGRSHLVHAVRNGAKIFVAAGGRRFCLQEPEHSPGHLSGRPPEKAERTLKAPMPGVVRKVSAAEGLEVHPGDSLVVVEAMKMEHEMRAAFHAIVRRVHVKAGQQVDAFQPLVELTPAEPEES